MAQIPMNGSVPQDESPMIVGNVASWAGAIVSLGLLIGAGIWGYKLLVRDVTGVPVVRAIEGPMREQPVDPGGQQAEHQGLAVNNVPAEGTAAAPADRLVLAPPPITLTDTDSPAIGENIAMTVTPNIADPSADQSAQSIAAPTPIEPGPIEPGDVDSLIGQLVAANAAATETEETPAPLAEPQVAKEGLGTSLRPKLRPAKPSVPTPVQVASVEGTVDVAPESLLPGTRLVQLGAFATAEIARDEWDKMQAKFGDYLGDKKRVIQKAASGGRTFYRLRAMGFTDLNDARRLCSALKAENADCIPVVTR